MAFLSMPAGRTRNRMGAIFFVSILIATLSCSIGLSQDIQWQSDLEKAKTEARQKNKLVLLHFAASWSRAEKDLQVFVFKSPAIQRAFRETVIAVKIDADSEKSLVEQYGVSTVPFDVAISPEGRVVTKRKSPVDTASYGKMLKGFKRINAELKSAADHQLDRNIASQGALVPQPVAGLAFPPVLNVPESFTPQRFAPPANQPANRVVVQPVQSAPLQVAVTARPSRSQFVPNPFTEPSPPIRTRRAATASASETQRPMANGALIVSAPKPASSEALQGEWKQRRKAGTMNRQVARSIEDNGNAFQPAAVAAQPVDRPIDQMVHPADFSREKPTRSIEENGNAFQPAAVAAQPVDRPIDRMVRPTDFSRDAARHQNEDLGQLDAMNRQLVSEEDSLSVLERDNTLPKRQPTAEKFALSGKCPVTLLTQSKWVDGDPRWECVHRNRTYLFSSEEKLKLFMTDPDAYSPILAGYDPVVFQESGELVTGQEKHGVFMGSPPHQRIVLFDSAANRARFQQEPLKYLDVVRQATRKNDAGSQPLLR